MKIHKNFPQMQLFSAKLAAEYGLQKAIVYQELIQAEGRRYPADAEHGVLLDHGTIWYRYDDNDFRGMFPYWGLDEVKHTINELEELGWIKCWRASATDFLWIAQGE